MAKHHPRNESAYHCPTAQVEVILGRAWMASRLALPVVFAVLGGEAILDYVGDENRILYWAILVRCKKINGAEALIILYSRLGFSCYRRERQRSQGADHYSPIDAVYSRRSVSGAPLFSSKPNSDQFTLSLSQANSQRADERAPSSLIPENIFRAVITKRLASLTGKASKQRPPLLFGCLGWGTVGRAYSNTSDNHLTLAPWPVEESKAEDEANVEDTAYPGKEDGLDSLSFMAWAKP
ncbi:hypothetical protein QVD17_42331 [Tagetes erecta]|uniref:Uncharacterized protein n=1 Tax=Tagetes erecta TaxID=13708 RepID=A0AAD8N8N5_TARER|nr:hypothetical protein QVD17_42331 [Tagetes erecta]